MPKKSGESILRHTWQTFCGCSDLQEQQLNELTDAVQQYSDSVTRFNLELLTLGSQLAAEHAKLRERLLKCQDAPGIIKLELDYLDTMRQHYTDELARLFGIGDEVVKRSVMAWSNGKGPHEASVNASQRAGQLSQ